MRFLKVSVMLLAALGAACSSDDGSQAGGAGGSSSTTGGNGPGGSVGVGGGVGPANTPPGRVTLRRLNAREYDNTIRDLVYLDLKPSVAHEFPAEEWGDGFDNDAEVLTTSSLAAEKYLTASQAIVKAVFADPAAKAKVIACAPDTDATCAASTISEFARRAFRRTVAAEEIAPFLTLVELAKSKGDTAEVGVGLALAAVLTSPHFLFLVEPDPVPSVVRQLTAFEMASRLSYFIWSTMPDEPLFQAAAQGKLTQGAEVVAQVQRMLADPKSKAFSDVLATQWMQTVALKYSEPSTTVFPQWNASLKVAMEQELREFLAPIVKGTAPATDLLSASYTYVNKPLAEYYGLPNAATLTDQFVRVDLDVSKRGGVLRQGSFLVHTSHPDRNAPTKRGKWILERLLCDPPPAPPAIIPALETNVPFEGTLRQRLDQLHKNKGATCAACHAIMDPMGFAMENYDAVGLWRDMDGPYPVDASGNMPATGEPFTGAADVTRLIVADPRFSPCVAKQLMTFALGRKVTEADKPLLQELGTQFAQNGSMLPKLAELVATSVPMMYRQTEAK